METNKMSLDEMTGASRYSNNRLNLDTLSLNGDGEIKEINGKYVQSGGFFRIAFTSSQKKGEKPEEIKLGDKVKVVFLKIRRTLQERNAEKVVRWTSEHNTADDYVELRSANSQDVISGSAKSLREQYPNLKTIQIVYGLLLEDGKGPKEVKIRIKGASLGSEVKAEGVMTFYEYLSSFDKSKDEHVRNYVTELSAIKEEGKKTYFCIKFTRGEKLSAETQKVADESLVKFYNVLSEQDSKVKAKKEIDVEPKVTSQENPNADLPVVEYPEDEINPEDIPF